MYVVKRKSLPPSKGFDLGRLEIPVIVVALDLARVRTAALP